MDKKSASANKLVAGQCAQAGICPLSAVRAGTVVCIKQLAGSVEVSDRLREMGFCEEQRIKLLSVDNNIICLVCNSRLGISAALAKTILVAPLDGQMRVA